MPILKPAAAFLFEPFTNSDFWFHYRRLPPDIRQVADTKFQLLKENPHHPSLRLKKVGLYWAARVSLRYRALAKERAEGLVWFWIGAHDKYEEIVSKR
jgi:hypothetical protein